MALEQKEELTEEMILTHIQVLQNLIDSESEDIESIVHQLVSVVGYTWEDNDSLDVRDNYRALMFNLGFYFMRLSAEELLQFVSTEEGLLVVQEVIRVTSYLGNSSENIIMDAINAAKRTVATPEA